MNIFFHLASKFHNVDEHRGVCASSHRFPSIRAIFREANRSLGHFRRRRYCRRHYRLRRRHHHRRRHRRGNHGNPDRRPRLGKAEARQSDDLGSVFTFVVFAVEKPRIFSLRTEIYASDFLLLASP